MSIFDMKERKRLLLKALESGKLRYVGVVDTLSFKILDSFYESRRKKVFEKARSFRL